MVAYTLRARDLEYARKAASMFAERPTGYKSWFPVETIPPTDIYYWYLLSRMVQPVLSMDGASYVGVRTARVEDSAPIIWMRYGFQWGYTEIEAAQRTGIPLKADDINVALHNMRLKIGQLILEGIDTPDVINGLTEDGTDLGATLDAILWASADQAQIHAQTAVAHMNTYNHTGPFNWIVSSGIIQYLGKPLSSSGEPQGEYIKRCFNTDDSAGNKIKIFQETDVATATFDASEDAETIYQFQHTADDGIWVMIDPKPDNMALAQFWEPRTVLESAYDTEHNCWRGYVEWAGTLRISQPTACGFMEDVDIA